MQFRTCWMGRAHDKERCGGGLARTVLFRCLLLDTFLQVEGVGRGSLSKSNNQALRSPDWYRRVALVLVKSCPTACNQIGTSQGAVSLAHSEARCPRTESTDTPIDYDNFCHWGFDTHMVLN
jgi:hypothetical protein